MTEAKRQSRIVHCLIVGAMLIGQVAGFLAVAQPAKAAVSADPNAEIVYIDDKGVIRVLDTVGDPLVQWHSPDGGWDQIVLADVNNDGDKEIIALDKGDGSTMRVAVFDPVVAKGATDVTKEINGIPWDTLFQTAIVGNGQYIVAGNFDAGIPGDEFAVGFMRGTASVIQIYDAKGDSIDNNGNPTGRDWAIHVEKEYPGYQYTYATSGNLDGKGTDELIDFDQDSPTTRMDVYKPDEDMFLTDKQTSDNDRFKYGVTGQLNKDGPPELVAVLSGRVDKPSLRTYKLGANGKLDEDALYVITPQPDWAFLADIRGNGDKELFFLSKYPEGKDGPRLSMRDDWGDDQRQNTGLISWSLMDGGSNNEFRGGAGGDVDGDGKDEVILSRNDRIRVYFRPENGNQSSANYTDYMLPTDNKRFNLLVGDLDRNGFSTGPVLAYSNNAVNATMPAGTVGQDMVVTVSNIGAPATLLGINASVPSGNDWVKQDATFLTFNGTDPLNFHFHYDATKLTPGEYHTTMTFVANQPNVVNDNFVVGLNLTVVPPTLNPSPAMLNFYQFPCPNTICSGQTVTPTTPPTPITSTVRINGSTNLTFRATILGVPKQGEGTAAAAGLAGPVTGGKIDENGNIVVSDAFGNSHVVGDAKVVASAATSATVLIDPGLTWVTSATLSSNVVPADLTLVVNPSILTKGSQREYALVILVADTRAGSPTQNVYFVPIQMANIGRLLYLGVINNN